VKLRILRGSFAVVALVALTAPTWAGSQFEKTLTLNPGGRFTLDSDDGSVSVTGTDQPGARVVITSNRDDTQNVMDFNFDENPGSAGIRARHRSHLSLFSSLNLHYEVRVPKTTAVEIKTGGGAIEVNNIGGEAELYTSGGAISVSGLTGRLRARTSGGGVHAQDVHGDTDLESSGGSIEADSIDGDLIAHTSGGPIRIEKLTGRVDAHTSGGGISAALSRNNAHGGVLESSGGSISVAIDPTANLQIDAWSSGGRVSSDLPVRVVGTISEGALRGALGSGGEMLKLHTSGGSVHLRSL
jgi:DUF4097 and DUF4098 domain-containing protein YvlB